MVLKYIKTVFRGSSAELLFFFSLAQAIEKEYDGSRCVSFVNS